MSICACVPNNCISAIADWISSAIQIQWVVFNGFRKRTICANAIADQLIAPPVAPIALRGEMMYDIPTDNCNSNCRNEWKKKLKIHSLIGTIYDDPEQNFERTGIETDGIYIELNPGPESEAAPGFRLERSPARYETNRE